MAAWQGIIHAFADSVFPRSCPVCERTLSSDDGLWCRPCAETLLAATDPDYCPRCGRTVGPHLVDPTGCRACRGSANPLDGLARVGDYALVIGDLVKKYKYGRQQRLDKLLGDLMVAAIQRQPWAGDVETLVPVPTTLKSRLTYRFRPVHQLAQCVGRELGVASLPLVYVRGKKRKQVGLPQSQRADNVRGVFHVHAQAHVAGRTFCVIDDVMTTGSTLREIARVLKRAGARRVYGTILAETDPSQARALRA